MSANMSQHARHLGGYMGHGPQNGGGERLEFFGSGAHEREAAAGAAELGQLLQDPGLAELA